MSAEKTYKEMLEDAINKVQNFIDEHIEDKDKAHISTYIHQDELGAMIFLVKSILSNYPLARPYELYKNDYACKFSRNNAVLLGFMQNTSHYSNLGFDHDGKNYVSVFTLEEPEPMFVGELTWGGPPMNFSEHKYVMFFKGCDDASFGLRFENREEREQFLEDHQVFTEFIRSKCLYSN